MIKKFLQSNFYCRTVIYKIGKLRAKKIINSIEKKLVKNCSIIDIGAGTCNTCEILLSKNYSVTPLDIKDLSFTNGISPIIYDGTIIPFDNEKFDIALLLTVLHHTKKPEKVIDEAKRVATKIIIIEDIYTSNLEKKFIYIFDSLLNLEFVNHPHTNKNDAEWRETFRKVGLRIIDVKYTRSFFGIKQAIYFVENKKG
jgi:ubiquinone/menaquinone biosynthesis C-methylase UbiE